MKISRYINKSIIFGKGPKNSTFSPLTINVRGETLLGGDKKVLLAHQNNLVGWTPTTDYDFIFLNYVNVISTSSDKPGVYGAKITLSPTVAQEIQGCGRAGRLLNTGGFLFVGPTTVQSTLRFIQQ